MNKTFFAANLQANFSTIKLMFLWTPLNLYQLQLFNWGNADCFFKVLSFPQK
jgi:hypothetical protein